MNLLGIPTPAVLGFVEQRFGPLRKRAYLISEYVEHASELSQVYADEGNVRVPMSCKSPMKKALSNNSGLNFSVSNFADTAPTSEFFQKQV